MPPADDAHRWHVYVLRCADDSLYTGIALDVGRRLEEHRAGVRGAKYLRGRGPFELVLSCVVGERGDALRLEHHIKQLTRRDKQRLVACPAQLDPVIAAIRATTSKRG